MAKASINTGETGRAVHTRTTQTTGLTGTVAVLGIDESDGVVPADATTGLRTHPAAASAVGEARVNGATSSTTLRAANTSRRGLIVINDSTAVLRVKFGTAASATSFTYRLEANETLELPEPMYTGAVTGIWETATGAAQVTELT